MTTCSSSKLWRSSPKIPPSSASLTTIKMKRTTIMMSSNNLPSLKTTRRMRIRMRKGSPVRAVQAMRRGPLLPLSAINTMMVFMWKRGPLRTPKIESRTSREMALCIRARALGARLTLHLGIDSSRISCCLLSSIKIRWLLTRGAMTICNRRRLCSMETSWPWWSRWIRTCWLSTIKNRPLL